MALIWTEFSECPYLMNYQRLKSHADKTGNWSYWREKALSIVPRRKAGSTERRYGLSAFSDNSTRVEIFLWENNAELAWDEALSGGCSNNLWMELAKQREDQHPDDSLRVYLAAVESLIQQKNNQSYADAIRLLVKINKIMVRLNRSHEFRSYVASVRAAHKPKRNFIKMLDETRWEDKPDG
jgi:uncharacterized Zn finger protein